jgi:DNA invertase Pin-like site-specific DNA recombinase
MQDVEVQLVKLRKFCENRKFQIYREYTDISSGANWNRPQLKELMEDARHRCFDAVVVTKLDRFGRSLLDISQSIESFHQWGIEFICVDQPIDTTIPSGKLLFQILSAIAEFERELIRDRIRDGLVKAKKMGTKLGRPKKKVDEQKVLTLYSKLNSTREVAKELGISHVSVYNLLKKHPEIFNREIVKNFDVQKRNDLLTGE